ncbi:MAG TPA: CotH kinase family protein, partial [Verrucomicrobiota bacterium]|nr:CotH kinase family protein [Verrucomicrobiota bacterium]
MFGKRSSAYVRFPFQLANPGAIESLTLRLKFKDGFVAYLNGGEVCRVNVPESVTWDSLATATRSSEEALEFVNFDLTDYKDLLHVGLNVLAVHLLNTATDSPGLLLVAELVGASRFGRMQPRFFPVPTPGRANQAGVEVLGPLFNQVAHDPKTPVAGQDIVVTAKLREAFAPITSVTLCYRVMFGPEVTTHMFDDGFHGDGGAGDSLYGGVIPSTTFGPGDMVRWYILAIDGVGNASRWPAFQNSSSSPAYLGTVVSNGALVSPLPVFHWFVEKPAAADGFSGTRGSVFFEGEFYDNVLCRVRGASGIYYPKKSYKFDFNPGHHFRIATGSHRVDEINLNSTYQDKAMVRQSLAFETYQQAGVPACDTRMVRVERNGAFFSVAVLVEQVDETFLERHGLNPKGALYKVFNGLDSTSGVEKKTRQNEDSSDLQQLVSSVAMGNPARGKNVFELLDLPEIINYLAAGVVVQDWDRAVKNYYLYCDTEGTGLWQMFPWDEDLTFGKTGLANDSVTATKDGTIGAAGEPYVSHPFYGMAEKNCCGVNHLFDAIYSMPSTREMFLRRLRTLMDMLLQPPDTPLDELRFEARLNDLFLQLKTDAALDLERWGAGYGVRQDLATAMTVLKNNYLKARRVHLYQTHSLAASLTNAAAVGIPPAQIGNPVVEFGAIDANPISGNQSEEYIELINENPTAVDISGWRLDGEVRFLFSPGTVVCAGGRLYVSPDLRAFKARSTSPRGGEGHLVVGPYSGQLSARGGSLSLIAADGAIVSITNRVGQPTNAQQFLRVTELMYHPASAEGSLYDTEEFEYIELTNIGPRPLDLRGLRFVAGIEFSFADSGITELGPGASVLIVRNSAAFMMRYGDGLPVAGEYAGHLDNAGERIRLVDANDEEIIDFQYKGSWYPDSDGFGASLEPVDCLADATAWNNRTNWRASNPTPGLAPGVPPQQRFAPSIITDPIGGVVFAGESVALAVTALGTPPLTYHWQRNGTPLPGAMTPVFSIPRAESPDSGFYRVVVSNCCGVVTSATAVVRVERADHYASAVLADSPLHYYRLDEVSGNTVADVGVAGRNTGRLNGGVAVNQQSVVPALGQAVRFDGSPGTFIDLGLFHPGGAITVEAWVNLDSDATNNPSYNAIVARWDGSYELDVTPGDKVNFVVRNQSNAFGLVASPQPIDRCRWYHLVGTYGNGLLCLYIDGTNAASVPFPGVLRDGGPVPDRVLVGATRDGSSASFQWKGLIDEVALYNYVLSPLQVSAHYQAATQPRVVLSMFKPGLLSWPRNSASLILQSTESLNEPAEWRDVPEQPFQQGSFAGVLVNAYQGQNFYRLIRR